MRHISLAIYANILETPCMHACVLYRFSPVQLFATLQTVACQVPLSMWFSRQEYWSGSPCAPPGYLSDPRIAPHLLWLLHCRQTLHHWATGQALEAPHIYIPKGKVSIMNVIHFYIPTQTLCEVLIKCFVKSVNHKQQENKRNFIVIWEASTTQFCIIIIILFYLF